MKKIIGIALIIVGIAVFVFVSYTQSKSTATRTFSEYSILSSSWERYKPQFILPEGRVVDLSQNSVTTSEGQSYAMLRAVWIDDKETFDLTWKWTKDVLKRQNDNLFGWRWGERSDGTYGFLENGGENAASDADQDIALALIFASKRWNDSRYMDEAKVILKDLWDVEVDTYNGKNYMVAGNWAKGGTELVLNPSYFAPYAWRIFAEVDRESDWLSLIDPAYEILNESGKAGLDRGKAVGLPPNWVSIVRDTGELRVPAQGGLNSDYSFDAMRTPFRIALDYKWFGEERAKQYLTDSYQLFYDTYTQQGILPMTFSHAGDIIAGNENPSMYATALGYFVVVHPDLAKDIYEQKILGLYASDKNSFNSDLPYYDANWLWFGTGLYNDFLINLYSEDK